MKFSPEPSVSDTTVPLWISLILAAIGKLATRRVLFTSGT